MKLKKEILFGAVVLIFSILACSLPGISVGSPDIPATSIVVADTASVAIENTATLAIPTETPIAPTSTPSVSPEITLTKNSNCRLGPSTFYNVVDQISEKKVLKVIGRNDDNTWWQVLNATGRECWIFNENADENTDFSTLPINVGPPLPGVPANFFVVDQLCQSGLKKFSVSFSWASGGGETSFRIFRNGDQIVELKATKFNYKDINAPYNKNLSYEIDAVNSNGSSQRAVQIVPACK